MIHVEMINSGWKTNKRQKHILLRFKVSPLAQQKETRGNVEMQPSLRPLTPVCKDTSEHKSGFGSFAVRQ